MSTKWFKVGAISSALAVAFGAFGAHALKPMLEASEMTSTYKTAVLYHFLHSLFLLFISSSPFHRKRNINQIALLAFLGILLFSGSLYLLVLFQWRWLGPITPLGGLAYIAAWVLAAVKTTNDPI